MKYKTWVLLKTILLSLGGLLIITSITLAIVFDKREQNRIDKENKRLDALTQELRFEKRQCEHEITHLKNQIDGYEFDYGTISFLLTEPTAYTYNVIVKDIEKYGETGIIAIGTDFFTERVYMPKENLKELYDNGWEITIKTISLNDIEIVKEELEKLEIDSHSVYFRNENDYKADFDTRLSEYGIDTVISYCGTTQIHQDGMFEIMAYGCNETGYKTALFSSIEGSKPLIFTIGSTLSRETYSTSTIASMIKFYKQAKESEEFSIENTAEMKSIYTEYVTEWEKAIPLNSQKIIELKSRIEELDKEIQRIRTENK